MDRRVFLASAIALAAAPRRVGAQGAPKVSRIGWLTAQRALSLAPFLDAFRGGLSQLGWIEHSNLEIEYRYGDDDIQRIPQLAAELVRQPVDLIVAQGAAVDVVYDLKLPIP